MKYNFILPLALCIAVVGCGKSEEEIKKEEAAKAIAQGQAQLAAITIEHNQKEAIAEALTLMSKLKAPVAEYFSQNNECMDNIQKADNLKYVDTLYMTKDCEMKTTFKKSAYTPDLEGQTLSLKMTVGENAFLWSCSFSGKSELAPSVCNKDK